MANTPASKLFHMIMVEIWEDDPYNVAEDFNRNCGLIAEAFGAQRSNEPRPSPEEQLSGNASPWAGVRYTFGDGSSFTTIDGNQIIEMYGKAGQPLTVKAPELFAVHIFADYLLACMKDGEELTSAAIMDRAQRFWGASPMRLNDGEGQPIRIRLTFADGSALVVDEKTGAIERLFSPLGQEVAVQQDQG